MINALLRDAWHAQRQVVPRTADEGRLLDFTDHRIYAGVEPGNDRRFVAIRLDAALQDAIKERRPRSTRGILTEQRSDGDSVVIFLREQPGIPESVFPAVMEDVIGVAIDGDRLVGMRRAIERFNSWQSAFERRSGPLTAAEVRGMIGELVTLRDVVIPACGAQKAVERWAAISDEGLHDFMGEQWVLEAKSILFPATAFHVSTADQLQPGNGEVFLSVVELEKATEQGESLNELLSALSDLMGDPLLQSRFIEATIKRGVRDASIVAEADAKYRIKPLRSFKVMAGFPVIPRSVVPLAVDNVEYDVELYGCMNFEIGHDVLVNIISQIEGLS